MGLKHPTAITASPKFQPELWWNNEPDGLFHLTHLTNFQFRRFTFRRFLFFSSTPKDISSSTNHPGSPSKKKTCHENRAQRAVENVKAHPHAKTKKAETTGATVYIDVIEHGKKHRPFKNIE